MNSNTDMLINYLMLVKTDLRLKWQDQISIIGPNFAIPSKRRGHARVVHMPTKCTQGQQRYSKNPDAHPRVLLSNRTVIISTSISSGIPYGHARIT